MDIHRRPKSPDIQGLLVDVFKSGCGARPAEKPQGIFIAHIHAAVAHWNAKIIVPVGTVERVALTGEESGPRDTHQWDVFRRGDGGAHIPGGQFDLDVEAPGRCVE